MFIEKNIPITSNCYATYNTIYKSLTVSFDNIAPPCYTKDIIENMLLCADAICDGSFEYSDDIEFFIIRSHYPNIFNLGADLNYLIELLKTKNCSKISDYVRKCITLIYKLYNGFNKSITTIALIEGKCFGGGLETALACDYIISNKESVYSFPEIKIGIFPGMGAASIMSNFLSKSVYNKIFLTGLAFNAHEFFEMGIIDQLFENLESDKALNNFFRKSSTLAHKHLKNIYKSKKNIDLNELLDIGDKWIDCLMNLDKRQLILINFAAMNQN